MGDPLRLIEERQQRVDVSGERLALATRRLVERRDHELAAARLVSPVAVLVAKQQALVAEARVLEGAMRRYVGDTRQKIERASDRIEQYVERLRRCGTEHPGAAVSARSTSSASSWRATPSIPC